MKSKKTSERLGQALLWVLLIGALLIFSIPFLFMITNSFPGLLGGILYR